VGAPRFTVAVRQAGSGLPKVAHLMLEVRVLRLLERNRQRNLDAVHATPQLATVLGGRTAEITRSHREPAARAINFSRQRYDVSLSETCCRNEPESLPKELPPPVKIGR
jgi:hypothetical protein